MEVLCYGCCVSGKFIKKRGRAQSDTYIEERGRMRDFEDGCEGGSVKLYCANRVSVIYVQMYVFS